MFIFLKCVWKGMINVTLVLERYLDKFISEMYNYIYNITCILVIDYILTFLT